MRWLSARGQLEAWYFTGDVDDKPAVADVTSKDSADGRREVAVRRPGSLTRTLRADNLTDQEFDALSTILESPGVWQQSPNGQTVPLLVVPGSLIRTSDESRHTVTIDVRLPRRNALAG